MRGYTTGVTATDRSYMNVFANCIAKFTTIARIKQAFKSEWLEINQRNSVLNLELIDYKDCTIWDLMTNYA